MAIKPIVKHVDEYGVTYIAWKLESAAGRVPTKETKGFRILGDGNIAIDTAKEGVVPIPTADLKDSERLRLFNMLTDCWMAGTGGKKKSFSPSAVPIFVAGAIVLAVGAFLLTHVRQSATPKQAHYKGAIPTTPIPMGPIHVKPTCDIKCEKPLATIPAQKGMPMMPSITLPEAHVSAPKPVPPAIVPPPATAPNAAPPGF